MNNNENNNIKGKALEEKVDSLRITLVDNTDTEYEFIILDEIEHEGRRYLALVSCDEKVDQGSENDPGEGNDITIVGVEGDGEDTRISAVTAPDVLLALSRIIDGKFGHLG